MCMGVNHVLASFNLLPKQNKIPYIFGHIPGLNEQQWYRRAHLLNLHAHTVISIVRTMMMHAAIHWPEVSDPSLWPMAVQHAALIFNPMPVHVLLTALHNHGTRQLDHYLTNTSAGLLHYYVPLPHSIPWQPMFHGSLVSVEVQHVSYQNNGQQNPPHEKLSSLMLSELPTTELSSARPTSNA
jgi:hypothetical protein